MRFLDYAIYLQPNGTLSGYVGATYLGILGTYATGDVLRVAIEGGVVKYKKNGTVFYTATAPPNYPLMADTALYTNGATISNVVISSSGSGGSGGAGNVGWTNTVGVNAATNNLTKTAPDGWGNAGAVSTQTITSGDGYMEFTASETSSYRLIGLSNGDTNQNYDDIDFAIYLMPNGNLGGYVGATFLGILGTYATGDVLRVAIEGGVVKYKKNGTVFYTATAAPNYPLMVDTSLYTIGATINNVVINGASSGGGSSAQIHWLVTDQLGTPRMIFDQSGALANVSRHDYLPFGEELFAGTGGRTTAQGYSAGDGMRQHFTGSERDGETGLDYMHARYYGSAMGRFTGVDPLQASAVASAPQSFNRYAYAANNPLRYTDPSGMFIVEKSPFDWGAPDFGGDAKTALKRDQNHQAQSTASSIVDQLIADMGANPEPQNNILDSDVFVDSAFISVGRTKIEGRIKPNTNDVAFQVSDADRDTIFGADLFRVTLNLILPKGTIKLDESEPYEGDVGTRTNPKGSTADFVGGSRVTLNPIKHPDENNFWIGKGLVTFGNVNFREGTADVSFMVHFKQNTQRNASNRLDVLVMGSTRSRQIKTIIPVTIR